MFDKKKEPVIDNFCEDVQEKLKTALLEDFINIIERKSEHTEHDQRILLLMAFYSTLSDELPGYNELERTIACEGWDKKPVSDMLKHYAPSAIYNYKQMKKISSDYSPKQKPANSACYTF